MSLEKITDSLSRKVEKLSFAQPVAAAYNPLQYARDPMHQYIGRYGLKQKEILLVGMNPGPFGMAQTGVPFGDVSMVRGWLDIVGEVTQPKFAHPKRPVLGFNCERREVSGERLWGWAKQRYEKPKKFFNRFFVWNYCPLCFLEDSGRNRTPDKLTATEQKALYAACDQALGEVIETLDPKYVIGVGKFALARIESVLAAQQESPKRKRLSGSILHPSPASPIANRGWAAAAEKDFLKIGITL